MPKVNSEEESKVAPYVQGMITEGKSVRRYKYALQGYLNGNSSQGLPAEKRVLMDKQIKAMSKYSDILDERIALENT